MREIFKDDQHGYLKITVTKTQITCAYCAVPDPSVTQTQPLTPFDSVVVSV